jgi:hypothetical protein
VLEAHHDRGLRWYHPGRRLLILQSVSHSYLTMQSLIVDFITKPSQNDFWYELLISVSGDVQEILSSRVQMILTGAGVKSWLGDEVCQRKKTLLCLSLTHQPQSRHASRIYCGLCRGSKWLLTNGATDGICINLGKCSKCFIRHILIYSYSMKNLRALSHVVIFYFNHWNWFEVRTQITA